jgi:murein DD-endopeptidase MepM/ murein hydrolase activator NlpD
MEIEMIKTFFILITILTIVHALPKQAAYPGGIVVTPLPCTSKPLAFFNATPLMVRYHHHAWHVIAGVHLNHTSKSFPLTISCNEKNSTLSIPLKDKTYKKQYITLKTDKHITPNQQNLERIWDEKKRSLNALSLFTKRQHDFEFIKPVDALIDDDFGKRRYFNNQPRKPHSGVDMRAKTGTKIKAPLSGIVVISDNFFFNGNTIYIDHGEGMVSMYCHLNKRYLKKGDKVRQGDFLGEVGKTGRATGPHLHWGVALNGNMVDPRLLL